MGVMILEDTQLMTLITTSISNFGFPIVLTCYLLIRFEKKIEMFNDRILELLYVIKEEMRKN
ncbi:YvrJ family protein [Thermobacillus sp.]|uniref:YvrJ family protein n=1 Tax=Thermobacillus sp. TaxID=2108467 RepID=UPI0026BF7EF2